VDRRKIELTQTFNQLSWKLPNRQLQSVSASVPHFFSRNQYQRSATKEK